MDDLTQGLAETDLNHIYIDTFPLNKPHFIISFRSIKFVIPCIHYTLSSMLFFSFIVIARMSNHYAQTFKTLAITYVRSSRSREVIDKIKSWEFELFISDRQHDSTIGRSKTSCGAGCYCAIDISDLHLIYTTIAISHLQWPPPQSTKLHMRSINRALKLCSTGDFSMLRLLRSTEVCAQR